MTRIPFQTPEPAPLPRPRTAPATLARSDPRWLLAARAQLLMTGHPSLPPQHRDRLLKSAAALGFAPIHAAAILTIAQQAALRGGLDHAASLQLAQVPPPEQPTRRDMSQWLNLCIAILTVCAGAIAITRFM